MLDNFGFVVGGIDNIPLEMMFEFHAPQQGPRNGADEESAADIGDGNRNPKFTRHKNYEIFVDDGGGDEKGKGYPQRYTRFQQADKNWNG